jgi:hypothetical protein
MSGHRSAWTDPEHVRLASYRSWMDGDRPTVRGPVPGFLDPWRSETAATEAPPATEPGVRRFARYDGYAACRCSCGHLQYADEKPGGKCRFCACADHRPRGAS